MFLNVYQAKNACSKTFVHLVVYISSSVFYVGTVTQRDFKIDEIIKNSG